MFGNGEIPVLFTAGVEFEKSSQIFPDKAPRCDNVLWKWVSEPKCLQYRYTVRRCSHSSFRPQPCCYRCHGRLHR